MGAYSPASILTPALETEVIARIIRPTVETMAAEGVPYSGVLYAGLMLTDDGPKLIEYNARFGDPECQALMMRFDGDLLDLLYATARGKLADVGPVRLADEAALTVVMAAQGYPGTPAAGGRIGGLGQAETDRVRIFQAGTALMDGELVAGGGRVLGVTALGATVAEARDSAYAAVDRIDFPSGFCRRDIGWREIGRRR
jgi:phosphoribosylamine--glycine ligase